MKRLLCTLLCFGTLTLMAADGVKPYNQGCNITPTPLEMHYAKGEFTLTPDAAIVCRGNELGAVAKYFSSKIKGSTGYDLRITDRKPSKNYIQLSLVPNLAVNDEGYTLRSTAKGVEIKARTPQGAFYGMQTLMQMLPAEIESATVVSNVAWTVPAVEIRDEPRFRYRGQMMDVCRHFVSVDNIKKQIDALAALKINRFHWHLTEDQAWRIEIKKYPLLTQISSKRTEGEGTTYGPYFYTQDQIREVVAYAKERFIEVIPEIELPGHAVAVLTAYPEYSCTGGPFEVRYLWGISHDIYCGGNEMTYKFIFDILEEVIPLFESPYFHIGGDEAPKTRWAKCPKCQSKIKQLGYTDDKEFTKEQKLQSYFIRRMEDFLQSHNRRLIGWDEILEGGLAPTATVMSWRGEKGGVKAANMGRDVIMTPNDWLYMDNYQGDNKILPACNRRYIPLSKIYGYNPMPEGVEKQNQKHILGVQANAWTEYMYTNDIVEWCLYPRMIALSEIAWSSLDRKDYNDFVRRIDNQRVRLDKRNINYYIPVPQDKGVPSCNNREFTDKITFEFETTEPVKIVYTTDGSEPTANSTEYTAPLTFDRSGVLKTRSILVSGKLGDVRTIKFEKRPYAPAVAMPANKEKGVKCDYYWGYRRRVSELDGNIPFETEYLKTPQESKFVVKGAADINNTNNYNTVAEGYINIPEDGVYFISTRADQMWLDDQPFISNEGMVRRYPLTDRSVALAKGVHKVKVIRLCGVDGGWYPLWEPLTISVRKDNEKAFRNLDAQDYL